MGEGGGEYRVVVVVAVNEDEMNDEDPSDVSIRSELSWISS